MIDYLYSLSNRRVEAPAKQLLLIAIMQPGILRSSLLAYQEADREMSAFLNLGPNLGSMFAPGASAPEMVKTLNERTTSFTGKIQMSARSFVTEVGLSRSILATMRTQVPSMATDLDAILDAFDLRVPNVVGLRNTIAHYDARILGLSQKGQIAIRDDDPDKELAFGWRIREGRFAARMADGNVGEISLSDDPIKALDQALASVLDLFEWTGPGEKCPVWKFPS